MDLTFNVNGIGLDGIKRLVEESQGVKTFEMSSIRDAYGKAKLGVHVLSGISKELAGLGLGHYPKTLPNYQHETVRIYKLGSPVADIIDSVLQPNDESDELLRQKSAGDDAEVLRQVREIVCR